MSLTRSVTVIAGLGLLLLTGCEAGGVLGQSGTSPTAPGAAGGSYPGPCPVGTWQLGDLKSSASLGGAELTFEGGGSMRLTMEDGGRWELSDDGSQPLNAKLGTSGVSTAGTLTVDGSADGRYVKSGDKYTFQVQNTEGSAQLRSDVLNQTFDMDQLTDALVPSGQATVSCSGNTLLISSGEFEVRWTYAGGGTAAPSATASGSAAGELVVSSGGDHDCSGRDVKVTGSSVSINLTGNCGRVAVNGSSNNVEIAAASEILVTGTDNNIVAKVVSRIEARGSRNNVRWGASPSGGEPDISTSGTDNRVERGQ